MTKYLSLFSPIFRFDKQTLRVQEESGVSNVDENRPIFKTFNPFSRKIDLTSLAYTLIRPRWSFLFGVKHGKNEFRKTV